MTCSVRCSAQVGHASATTTRTQATAFATERNRPFVAAAATLHPAESVREHAAAQIGPKFLVNEVGHARLGRLRRPSDLLRVKGIGPRLLERMLPLLVLDEKIERPP